MKAKRFSTEIHFLALCITNLVFNNQVYASTVSSDIPYQDYLDFANNKGKFQAGVSGQKIFDRNGHLLTTLNIPMVDFSPTNINGRFATLVDPQHIVSVIHNVGYRNVQFGQKNNEYSLINSNTCYKYSAKKGSNEGIYCNDDFHSPRLDKLVTDVVPAEIFSNDLDYKNLKSKRYTHFYRTGTGTQKIYNPATGNTTWLAGAYAYATGGIDDPKFITLDGHVVNYKPEGEHFNTLWLAPADFTPSITNPLPTLDESGDSGSPLYVYDNTEKKWKVISVVHAGTWWHNKNVRYRTLIPVAFYKEIIKKDNIEIKTTAKENYKLEKDTEYKDNYKITDKNGNKIKSFGGLGTLPENTGIEYPDHNNGNNYLNKALDHGKNIILSGGGTITLQNNINQGAGSITFNDDYTIDSITNITHRGNNRPDRKIRYTWTGGGLNIAEGKTVTWKINEMPYSPNQNNNLHKIGKGTLIINAVGLNLSGLRIGDGLTILKQQEDDNGFIGAGDELWLVSGRPTVKLEGENQLLPNTIYWGYRGGIFDTNGYNLDFNFLNGADFGARLTNQNPEKISTINLIPDYNYSDGKPYLYHGQILGNINFNLDFNKEIKGTDNSKITNSKNKIYTYVFDGSIGNKEKALKSFTINGGRVVLQGHPVIHSYIGNDINNTLKKIGEKAATTPTSATQLDWENRLYHINQLNINNSTLAVGRNANVIIDDVMNLNNAKLELGINTIYTDPNDGSGIFYYKKSTTKDDKSKGILATENKVDLDYANLSPKDKPTFTGRIVANKSEINLSGIDLYSQIQAKDTTITFNKNSLINGNINLFNSTLNLNSSTFIGSITNKEIITENTKKRTRRSLILLSLPTETIAENLENTIPVENINNSNININNSKFILNQDSRFNNLNLSGYSELSFAPSENGHTLTVTNLNANNQDFIFNIYGKDRNDKLVITNNITGKNNKIKLSIKGINKTELLSILNKKINLIYTTNSTNLSKIFTIKPFIESGKMYNLITHFENGILSLTGYQIGYIPTEIIELSQLLDQPLYLFLHQANLSKNINHLNKKDNVYINTEKNNIQIKRLKIKSNLITIGIKHNINYNTEVGLNTQLIQSIGNLDLLRNNSKQYLISTYLSYNLNNLFSYIEAKYSYIQQNIKHHNIRLDKNNISTYYIMLSSQIGYNYNLINDLDIQPSLQLTSGYLKGYSAKAKYLSIKVHNATPIVIKSKVDIIKKWNLAKIKFGLGYEYNKGMNNSSFNDSNYKYNTNSFSDKGFFINLSYIQNIKDNLKLSLSTERSFKQNLKQNTLFNIGLNYQF